MTTGPFLSPEGEEAWLRIKQHLELCDGFALAFLFTEHAQVITIFRERLAKIYRARVTRLITPVPENPSELNTLLLPQLLHPPHHKQAIQALYWIDLSHQRGKGWTEARLAFLIRLNEQREPLRTALKRPLLLILPLSERAQIKELVPDLWAIRDFSLVTELWVATEFSAQQPQSQAVERTSFPLSAFEESLLREWERLKEKKNKDRGFLLAADRALAACLRAGLCTQAFDIAASQEREARNRLQIAGETPEALRDLSISLNNVGKTSMALGRLETASEHYTESLGIRRQILSRVGETPEALRDLSISLDNVGQTAMALGRLETAEKYFSEGLAIAVVLQTEFKENPDYNGLVQHFEKRLQELRDNLKR